MHERIRREPARSRVPEAVPGRGLPPAASAAAQRLLALQRSAGNQVAARSVAPVVQRKIGTPPKNQALARRLSTAYREVLDTTRRIMQRRNSGQPDFMPPIDITEPLKAAIVEINEEDVTTVAEVMESYTYLCAPYGSLQEQIRAEIPYVFQQQVLDVAGTIQGRPTPGDYPEPSGDSAPA